MSDDDDEQTLADVHKWLKRTSTRYADMPDRDDAIQEGLIRAWKDMEDGSRDFHYIRSRARIWTKSHLLDDTGLPTGHPGRERIGIRKQAGDTKTEKVRMFVDEFRKLHDRLPSNSEIGQGVGMTSNRASYYKLKAQAPRTLHLTRERDDAPTKVRMDRRGYVSEPLQREGMGGLRSVVERQSPHAGADESYVANAHFYWLIEDLTPELQKVMILTHIYGLPQGEIGGLLDVAQATVGKYQRAAHGLIKHKIEGTAPPSKATRTHCLNEHEYTPENTGQNGKGRYCKTCRNTRRAKPSVNKGGKPRQLLCKRGHEFSMRKSGRYCAVCNAASMAARRAKGAKG